MRIPQRPTFSRRLLALLLLTVLALPCAALADPLPLVDDLAGEIVIPYDENDPSAGSFTYVYAYPAADPAHPDADLINTFFEYEASDTAAFRAPMDAENWQPLGVTARKEVSCTVTCNNDSFFSALIQTRETADGETYASFRGAVFSRLDPKPGFTITLPQLLGILSVTEGDTWLQERQTEKADACVRALIWERIEDNPEDLPFFDGFTEEDLARIFYPEEDFYLDENGTPVFFLQPGDAAPAEAGLITFPLPLEEILDEM